MNTNNMQTDFNATLSSSLDSRENKHAPKDDCDDGEKKKKGIKVTQHTTKRNKMCVVQSLLRPLPSVFQSICMNACFGFVFIL